MKQKITFDFTPGVEQIEVAVLPAHLAKKLLVMYAESLIKASTQDIVGRFIDDMREAAKDSMALSIDVAREWVDERTLIENISNNKWDVYAVKEEISKPDELKESFVGDEPEGVKIIGKINLHDKPNNASSDGI